MGLLRGLLLATALGLSVAPAAQAQLPSGPSVRSGRVGIERQGNELIIRSASERSVINWNRFSIGADQIVTYYQPSRSATVLNQVTSGIRSVIRGLLQSCISAGGQCRPTEGRGRVGGGVILVNPAGISVLGGHIITDHTLLTTAGINVQQFIDSGLINLTLAGDGLIEIAQGATLSGPLLNPTGLEGLSVVAPRIVVDGSVNIPEASSFIIQPQAKGTTEFVFNNVRPSRSFLKLDPGVHHSGVSTVHEESDRTRWFLLNGTDRTSTPCPAGAEGTSDCYSVTEHLTTGSTLEREFPLKSYTVATIPTIPASLWSVLPWAITSTRLETPERPPGIEPSQGCEPNGGENGTGEAVCVRDGLARFQRRQAELLTPQSTLISGAAQGMQPLRLETTAEGRVLLTRRLDPAVRPEPRSQQPTPGASCPAQPGLRLPATVPSPDRQAAASRFLQALIDGGLLKSGSTIVGEIPDFNQICQAGSAPSITVRQPGIEGSKQVPIGGCLQLTAVRSGCEPGAAPTPTPINFVLGSDQRPTTSAAPLDPEQTLGHVTDNHLVSIPVNPKDQTQLLNPAGEPIEGCQSSGTVLVPLPKALWENLKSGSSKLSTDPYQPASSPGEPLAPPLPRQGIFESLQCDQLLKPADAKRPATAQNILEASESNSGDAPNVLRCTYKETCAPQGQARVQSHKLFEVRDEQGRPIALDRGTIANLIRTMGLQLVEGQQTITPQLRGGEAQTDARMVPAGTPLAIGEVMGTSSPIIGRWQYSYRPGASRTTLNGQPQTSSSFVPQAGQDYTVRYTNVLERREKPADPPKPVTRFPCLEISKTGCPGSLAQFRVQARGGLARVYGTQSFNMLANGGPHRFCPKRDELEGTPDQFQGSIDIRELNAQPGSTMAASAAGQNPSLSTTQQGLGRLRLSFNGTAGRQGDGGQPQPRVLPITVTNPGCPPGAGQGTRACVKFRKAWEGGAPPNGSSPRITLKGPGAPVTVSQESGQRCYGNLQPGRSYAVSASETPPPQDSGNVVVQPTDQASISAGQAAAPELVLVNKRTDQRCITVTKTLNSAGALLPQQAFPATLTARTASGQQTIPLQLKPGESKTQCFDQLQRFKVSEPEQPGSSFTHLATKLNGRIVADRGQSMPWRSPGRNTVNRVELVNIPKEQLSSQACVEVQKIWLKDGKALETATSPLQQVTSKDSFVLKSDGRSNSLLADLKNQDQTGARVCRPMRPGEEWAVTLQERLDRLPKGWVPLPSATTTANLTAKAKPMTAQVATRGTTSVVSGLRVLAGNTERVILANQYREPVQVSRQDYCLRINKSVVGSPPPSAQVVTLEFSQLSTPLRTMGLGGRQVQQSTVSTNQVGEEVHTLRQTLDLASGSITQPVCFTDENFARGITLKEPSAAGIAAQLSATINGRDVKPDASGALFFSKRMIGKGQLAEVNLVNTYPEIPAQPFKPQVPALQIPTPQNPTPQGQTPPIPMPQGVTRPPQPRDVPVAQPPKPLRFKRFDLPSKRFVFLIPNGPEVVVPQAAMEQLPFDVVYEERRYRLLKPQLVRGLF